MKLDGGDQREWLSEYPFQFWNDIPPNCFHERALDCMPVSSMSASRDDKSARQKSGARDSGLFHYMAADGLDTNNIRAEIGIHMEPGPHPL